MPKRLFAALCAVCLPALAQSGGPLPLPPFGIGAAITPTAPSWGTTILPLLSASVWSAAPLGAGVPLLGGIAHPGLQMAPNWLSHQHLLYITNPYLGGPAAGNPYLQPTLPLPFSPPAFAPPPPMPGQASQRWPSAHIPSPLSPMQPMPARPSNPYLQSAPVPTPLMPFDPSGWLGQTTRSPWH